MLDFKIVYFITNIKTKLFRNWRFIYANIIHLSPYPIPAKLPALIHSKFEDGRVIEYVLLGWYRKEFCLNVCFTQFQRTANKQWEIFKKRRNYFGQVN